MALGAAMAGPRTARVEMMVVNFILMDWWVTLSLGVG